MSKQKTSMSSRKKMAITSVLALIAFIAFAGFTAQSVFNVSGLLSRASFSGKDGIPNLWSGATYSPMVSTNIEAKAEGDHLSYIATIENRNSTTNIYLTDIASRISDQNNSGFMAFTNDSLEYSYSKTNSIWTQVSGTNEEGTYKLADAIQIGPAGSSSNKVYLRYNVSAENGNVTDKVSFRLKNEGEEDYSIAVSDSSIAYEETVSEVVAVENKRTVDDGSGESAFAEPLGATTTASTLSTISASTATLAAISPEALVSGTIIIIAILGLFAGSIVAYFIIKARQH